MIPEFLSYTVEIKNLKYLNESGKRIPKTAILNFHIKDKTIPTVELMGYWDEESIFEKIDKGEDIDLSGCFINKFSLSNYKRTRNIDDKERIVLHNLNLSNCFIDSPLPLELSYCEFKGDLFNFSSTTIHKGQLSFSYSNFNVKEIDFSYLHYLSGHFDFTNVKIINGNISFKNSFFTDGKKDFQYTDFGEGEKNFMNIDFNSGDVSFINTQFKGGTTSFKISRFKQGKIDFHYAKFGEGNISFERTEFGEGGVDFRTVEFGSGRINFNRSVFGIGDINFDGCEHLQGKFSFKRANLRTGNLSFELAEMGNTEMSFERTNFGNNTISFYKGSFHSISFLQCHLDNYTDLRVKLCDSIDLSNTIVRDIIDIKSYEFKEKIRIIHFGGMRLIGRIYIDWKKNNVLSLINQQSDSGYKLKAEQFRTLKENFNICGQYNDEDLSYLHFKRNEAKAELQENLSSHKLAFLWAWPFYIFKLLIFDRAGHYATNPVRVISSMLVCFTLFSLLYFLLIISHHGNITESVNHFYALNSLGRSFYHSAITFFTIGYGDFYPDGPIRWLSGLEGFTGVFFMSYFTVAFVRKILR